VEAVVFVVSSPESAVLHVPFDYLRSPKHFSTSVALTLVEAVRLVSWSFNFSLGLENLIYFRITLSVVVVRESVF